MTTTGLPLPDFPAVARACAGLPLPQEMGTRFRADLAARLRPLTPGLADQVLQLPGPDLRLVYAYARACRVLFQDAAADITVSDQVHITEKGSVFLIASIIDRLLAGAAPASKPR